jgi:nucleoid-associated protein YgaU
MAIYESSDRYRLTKGGRFATRKEKQAVAYVSYLSKENDTFTSLAARILNDEKRYWEIADINPQIKWPGKIPTGTLLRIPR